MKENSYEKDSFINKFNETNITKNFNNTSITNKQKLEEQDNNLKNSLIKSNTPFKIEKNLIKFPTENKILKKLEENGLKTKGLCLILPKINMKNNLDKNPEKEKDKAFTLENNKTFYSNKKINSINKNLTTKELTNISISTKNETERILGKNFMNKILALPSNKEKISLNLNNNKLNNLNDSFDFVNNKDSDNDNKKLLTNTQQIENNNLLNNFNNNSSISINKEFNKQINFLPIFETKKEDLTDKEKDETQLNNSNKEKEKENININNNNNNNNNNKIIISLEKTPELKITKKFKTSNKKIKETNFFTSTKKISFDKINFSLKKGTKNIYNSPPLEKISKKFSSSQKLKLENNKEDEKYDKIKNNIIKEKIFLYIINPGNNSEIVKKCMSYRLNWKEAGVNAYNFYNFKWQHISRGIDFNSLSKNFLVKQMVNHFEFHSSISNKENLFISLMRYCEKKNLEVFKIIPMTIIINYESQNFAKQFESFENFFNKIENYVKVKDQENSEKEENENPENLINSEVEKYPKYANLFNCGLTGGKIGYKTSAYLEDTHYQGKNIWLVKAPDMNRGRCIKFGDNIDSIRKLIKQFSEGIFKEIKDVIVEENKINEEIIVKESPILKGKKKESKELMQKKILEMRNKRKEKMEKNFDDFRKYRANDLILQKYIEKPLLYYGRKFDIRMWVMIKQNNDIYAFREGHLKTSSINYDINSSDCYVHLTNYSVQKYNKEFSKFEEGNEVSFDDFQNCLDKEYGEFNISVRENIYPKICDLIKIVFFSVKEKINEKDRKECFEIFGFDCFVDKDFNVFLLEVNTNPGLEESSNLIKKLVPRMVDDALRLTIDECFETKYSSEFDLLGDRSVLFSPFPVNGYSDRDNLWDYIANMKNDE